MCISRALVEVVVLFFYFFSETFRSIATSGECEVFVFSLLLLFGDGGEQEQGGCFYGKK